MHSGKSHGKSTKGSQKIGDLHLAANGVGNGKAAEFIDAPVAIFPATWAWAWPPRLSVSTADSYKEKAGDVTKLGMKKYTSSLYWYNLRDLSHKESQWC